MSRGFEVSVDLVRCDAMLLPLADCLWHARGARIEDASSLFLLPAKWAALKHSNRIDDADEQGVGFQLQGRGHHIKPRETAASAINKSLSKPVASSALTSSQTKQRHHEPVRVTGKSSCRFRQATATITSESMARGIRGLEYDGAA